MDTNSKSPNASRLPVVLLTAALILVAAVAVALAHRDHRLKFQLGLANANLAAARANLATAKSDLAAAQAQVAQVQTKLDAAIATSSRLQAQMQQLAHMFGQSQHPFGRSHRLPVFAGFSPQPAQPGKPAPASFRLRVRSLVPGPFQITVKTSSSGKDKTSAFTISRFWTDPDSFAPGDKVEISSEGYPPMRLTVPNLPPRPRVQAPKPPAP
jgi:hypothetical protein